MRNTVQFKWPIALTTVATMVLFQATAVADPVKFIDAQFTGEVRASNLVGIVLKNKSGEILGDINDVVFQLNGQVTAYIVGVGGVLGIGEKNVAVPYADVALTTDTDGKRSATLDVTKAALEAAPTYAGERTTFEKVEDGASYMAAAAAQKAKELKDKMTAPKAVDPPK